jgi:hypothetical protein
MKLLLTLCCALLANCAFVPTPVPDGRGGAAVARIVGGKGMLNYNADGSMAFTFSLEKSLQHTIQGAVALGTAGFSYLTQVEAEISSRLLAGQITQRQANELMTQVGLAKIKLAETQSTTLNPNLAR